MPYEINIVTQHGEQIAIRMFTDIPRAGDKITFSCREKLISVFVIRIEWGNKMSNTSSPRSEILMPTSIVVSKE